MVQRLLHEYDNCRHRVFYKAIEKAKLRKIRINDIRHTFASLLIQAGESLAYVRDQLGHHSIKVTVDIYGHLVPGANRAAVDRLDDDQEETIRNHKMKKRLTNLVNLLIFFGAGDGI
jgi:integrase